MPAMRIRVRWPDGTAEAFYSPSTVVREFFVPGRIYPLAQFVAVARRALGAASERVRIVYGAPCGRAAASLRMIEARAAEFAEGGVTLERLEQE
jgi:uncharacterized repeat protein (TIGR04042 family)